MVMAPDVMEFFFPYGKADYEEGYRTAFMACLGFPGGWFDVEGEGWSEPRHPLGEGVGPDHGTRIRPRFEGTHPGLRDNPGRNEAVGGETRTGLTPGNMTV